MSSVKHLYTYDDPPSERHLDRAVELLRDNGVLAYPVGANWAFGCDASKPTALDRLGKLKPEHPKSKSYSLICTDISMAATFGHIDHSLYRILKKIWPGPYTIIVPSSRTLPRQLKDKRQVVGLRVPEGRLVRALVEKYGFPLASSSVPLKPSGEPYRMGYEIELVYGHALDLILDLGEELTGEESTVVDFSEGEAKILRVGLGDIKVFG